VRPDFFPERERAFVGCKRLFSPNLRRVQRDAAWPTFECARARRDRVSPAMSAPLKSNVAFWPEVLRVKMRWFVFLIVHADHDS